MHACAAALTLPSLTAFLRSPLCGWFHFVAAHRTIFTFSCGHCTPYCGTGLRLRTSPLSVHTARLASLMIFHAHTCNANAIWVLRLSTAVRFHMPPYAPAAAISHALPPAFSVSRSTVLAGSLPPLHARSYHRHSCYAPVHGSGHCLIGLACRTALALLPPAPHATGFAHWTTLSAVYAFTQHLSPPLQHTGYPTAHLSRLPRGSHHVCSRAPFRVAGFTRPRLASRADFSSILRCGTILLVTHTLPRASVVVWFLCAPYHTPLSSPLYSCTLLGLHYCRAATGRAHFLWFSPGFFACAPPTPHCCLRAGYSLALITLPGPALRAAQVSRTGL